MAGNTRGKIKENLEGVHNNFNWVLKHVNKSLEQIAVQLMQTQPDKYKLADAEKAEAALMTYPLYKGIKALGEAVEQLDELANSIYATV